ncbi:MAG: hypothetical protein HQL43_12715, partial [Alphaproteobacteria bacterium]|nr:hypothetical protein [Alphaproteobacteria bacterium]
PAHLPQQLRRDEWQVIQENSPTENTPLHHKSLSQTLVIRNQSLVPAREVNAKSVADYPANHAHPTVSNEQTEASEEIKRRQVNILKSIDSSRNWKITAVAIIILLNVVGFSSPNIWAAFGVANGSGLQVILNILFFFTCLSAAAYAAGKSD